MTRVFFICALLLLLAHMLRAEPSKATPFAEDNGSATMIVMDCSDAPELM